MTTIKKGGGGLPFFVVRGGFFVKFNHSLTFLLIFIAERYINALSDF